MNNIYREITKLKCVKCGNIQKTEAVFYMKCTICKKQNDINKCEKIVERR